MGPKSAMSVASTATVAAVFASNATARFPPARRWAIMPEPITVAARSIDPKPSATSTRRSTLGGLGRSTGLSDLTELRQQRRAIERVDRKTRQEFNSSFKLFERLAERNRLFGICTFDRRGVGDSPMRRHGLARPDGADFTGRVVADGENEIDQRRSRRRELIPALASKIIRWQIRALEQFDGHRMYLTFREAS